MSADRQTETREIVIDQVFPHSVEMIWKALTTTELIARWLMPPTGFEAIDGKAFTFQTTPAGAWDGVIHCEVLEVHPLQRLSFAWRGGDEGNVGYGARLDTVVTWTLTPVEAGTRVRLVHSGFVAPKNDTAYKNMSGGWATCVRRLDDVAGQ
jgi:uncharacterized protein YndB with AHSA1/START domain